MHLKIPPAIQLVIIAVIMWLIDKYIILEFDFYKRQITGWVIFNIGVIAILLGVFHFRKAKTTVDPTQPGDASQLVVSGIYKYSRNPMYLGMLFILIAFAIKLGNYLNGIPLIFFVWYMTTYQIKPEENALTMTFGDDYKAYCKKVRRWI